MARVHPGTPLQRGGERFGLIEAKLEWLLVVIDPFVQGLNGWLVGSASVVQGPVDAR